jgi:hypothetical protein
VANTKSSLVQWIKPALRNALVFADGANGSAQRRLIGLGGGHR